MSLSCKRAARVVTPALQCSPRASAQPARVGAGAAEHGGMLGTQLQDMGLESHIGSMGFNCGVYKTLGSPTTTTSFCGMVFPIGTERDAGGVLINRNKSLPACLSAADSIAVFAQD